MPYEPRGAVPRHIEFRHYADAAIPGVGDQISHLILRVVTLIGAQPVKFREFPAFGAKTLVLREVPVEHVHLHGFHAVEIFADDFEGDEMASGVAYQTARGETRLVLDRDHWRDKSVGRYVHQLQKCL